ncbi:hypothetical protein CHARACLAT_017151 [Characodon lateralis]|uniref:Uncharacterized protein n=1 Tax=Characodon lateralis TaxID=208331 RepID=A0ABU7EAC4_9TELE|nr:hypothetical protein [Characodon lateralis]
MTNGRCPSVKSHSVRHMEHLVHSKSLHYGKKASQRRQSHGLGNVLLGPAIHLGVTLMCTTYLRIVADHVRHFMETEASLSRMCSLPQNRKACTATMMEDGPGEAFSSGEQFELSGSSQQLADPRF